MRTDDQPAWAGFWRRLGAFLVDWVLVGVAGYLMGAAAFDALATMEVGDRLVGLALAVAYFGVLGSRIGGGQTLGKRAFNLRVAALDGGGLPLPRALLRALVLSLPFVVNGVGLRANGGLLVYVAGILAATALFGLGLAQLYLLAFNRPSRRLAHDLAAGSVVLRADGAVTDVPAGPTHGRIAIGIVATSFLLTAGSTVYSSSVSPGLLTRLRPSLSAVENLPEVMAATVAETKTAFSATGQPWATSRALVINVRLKAWPRDPYFEARRLAGAALAHYQPAVGQSVFVTLRYGFDLGFASNWRSYSTDIDHRP